MFGKRPAQGTKKGAIARKLSQVPAEAVLLFEDETILRLFPVLRRAWSLQGEQARVAITGKNARRALFTTIDACSGKRVVMQQPKMGQDNFQAFLHLLRRRYRKRAIWMLLDAGDLHTAINSQALAEELNIELIWLPKQCPELNAVDHLWRSVKRDISANYQFSTIEEHADFAECYVKKLTDKQALLRAGALSKNFWLRRFLCKNFCNFT